MVTRRFLNEVLERNGYHRKSFGGFKTDFPELYERYKSFCEVEGAYEMLDLLVTRINDLDNRWTIWVKRGVFPQILELKESYTQEEVLVLHLKTSIPLLELFPEPDGLRGLFGTDSARVLSAGKAAPSKKAPAAKKSLPAIKPKK